MATHRVPFLNWTAKPDDSGLVYLEPYKVTATNDLYSPYTLVFDTPGAAQRELFGQFEVPNNYASAGVVEVIYTSPVTTGSRFRIGFEYSAIGGNDSESLDPAAWVAASAVNASVPTTAQNRMTAQLTATSLTAGESIIYSLFRDGSQSDPDDDDVTGKLVVKAAIFQYSDV